MSSSKRPYGFTCSQINGVSALRSLREPWADTTTPAGRMVLTAPERYTPERYERFVGTVMTLLWPSGRNKPRISTP